MSHAATISEILRLACIIANERDEAMAAKEKAEAQVGALRARVEAMAEVVAAALYQYKYMGGCTATRLRDAIDSMEKANKAAREGAKP